MVIETWKDVDFIVKNKAPYIPILEDATAIPHSEFLKLQIGELKHMMAEKSHMYENDLTGAKTLIIKHFESDKEMMDWLLETDMQKFAEEMFAQYGPNSGQIDKVNRQLTITFMDKTEANDESLPPKISEGR